MEKVKSYEELSKLIFKHLKKDVATNSFLSKEEYEKEILKENLYYSDFPFGLLIMRDRKDYFILNYYLNITEDLKSIIEKELISIKKKIVVEVVGKDENDSKYLNQLDLFLSLNFENKISRIRYSLNSENVKISSNICSNANINDLSEILSLLKNNFNNLYGCIPESDALETDIYNNNFLKVVMDNKIVGILHAKHTKNSAEIRHLAVLKEYRRKGIASNLVLNFINLYKNLNKSVWTGSDNVEAQKVYEKYGFKKDGYVSTVFVK